MVFGEEEMVDCVVVKGQSVVGIAGERSSSVLMEAFCYQIARLMASVVVQPKCFCHSSCRDGEFGGRKVRKSCGEQRRWRWWEEEES